MERRRNSRFSGASAFRPSSSSEPEPASVISASVFSSVVLPAPLGPITASTSPAATSSESTESVNSGLTFTERERAFITGAPPGAAAGR